MPTQELELCHARIINDLKRQANIYNSFRKMQTTCRQIRGYLEGDFPSPRWGHHLLSLQNCLLLFGGYENSKYYNDLWKFDLQTLQFSPIEQKGEIPPPCSNFSMNYDSFRNKVIIFGGGASNKEKLNSVYQLDLCTFQWKRIAFNFQDSTPWQRSYHCAEIVGKYLVVFGGEFIHQFNDLWVFDTIKYKWRQVTLDPDSDVPDARKFAASFVWKQQMHVVGGCQGKYDSIEDAYSIDLTQLIEKDDVTCLRWNKLPLKNAGLLKRWGHACVVKEDKAYVFGGRTGSKDLQNLVEINLVTNECNEIIINGSLPRGRRRPGLCLRNNTIFCLSGFDGAYLKDFMYMPLMPRPHLQKKAKPTNPYLQRLKQELEMDKIPDFILHLDKDVFEISEGAYKKCIDYITTNVTTPLNIKNYHHPVCAQQFRKKSLFFKYCMERESNEVQLYCPVAIYQYDYQIVMELFILYMELGKIIFLNNQSRQKYLGYLLEMGEYYCLDHLADIIHRHEFEMFQKKLNSKKCKLQQLAKHALNIKSSNQKHGQYACYFMLMKSIDDPCINSLSDLIYLIEFEVGTHYRPWVFQMLNKYSFEINQKILHRQEVEIESRHPLSNLRPSMQAATKVRPTNGIAWN